MMSLNGGRDEKSGMQVAPAHEPYQGEYLEYDKVLELMDIYRSMAGKNLCERHEYHPLYA